MELPICSYSTWDPGNTRLGNYHKREEKIPSDKLDLSVSLVEEWQGWLMMAIFQLQGVILVYDITSKNSFEAVPKWLSYVRQVNKKKNELLTINVPVVDKEREKEDIVFEWCYTYFSWRHTNGLKITTWRISDKISSSRNSF